MAPYVNSYRRFESDSNSSAPTNFSWGYDNRATGLRVPNSAAQNRRLENRVVGVDCNPYLAIVAGLAAGYLGMQHRIAPGEPVAGELESDEFDIPTTLDEALTLFEDADELREVLGEDFCMIYSEVKQAEVRHFHREISPWEREHLLLNV
jgi:glutamine synthetase